MATKTFEELKQMAIQIRDEKANKQNTATRIGTQMLEHLNKLEEITDKYQNVDSYKGYFESVELLIQKFPNPSLGNTAWVGTPYPGNVYDVVDGRWHDTGVSAGGDEGGTTDYNVLHNKPSINNVILVGNKSFSDLDIQQKINNINVEVDNNVGIPSGNADINGNTITLSLKNIKGETGGIGPTGETGGQGNSGITGSPDDMVVVNNLEGGESLTGSIKVLAAEQGKVLKGLIDKINKRIAYVMLDQNDSTNVYADSNGNVTITGGGFKFFSNEGKAVLTVTKGNGSGSYAQTKTFSSPVSKTYGFLVLDTRIANGSSTVWGGESGLYVMLDNAESLEDYYIVLCSWYQGAITEHGLFSHYLKTNSDCNISFSINPHSNNKLVNISFNNFYSSYQPGHNESITFADNFMFLYKGQLYEVSFDSPKSLINSMSYWSVAFIFNVNKAVTELLTRSTDGIRRLYITDDNFTDYFYVKPMINSYGYSSTTNGVKHCLYEAILLLTYKSVAAQGIGALWDIFLLKQSSTEQILNVTNVNQTNFLEYYLSVCRRKDGDKTMLASWSDRINLLHISDNHVTFEDGYYNLQEAVNLTKIKNIKIDAFINTGDITNGFGTGVSKGSVIEQLTKAGNIIIDSKSTPLVLLGNHDANDYGGSPTIALTKKEQWDAIFELLSKNTNAIYGCMDYSEFNITSLFTIEQGTWRETIGCRAKSNDPNNLRRIRSNSAIPVQAGTRYKITVAEDCQVFVIFFSSFIDNAIESTKNTVHSYQGWVDSLDVTIPAGITHIALCIRKKSNEIIDILYGYELNVFKYVPEMSSNPNRSYRHYCYIDLKGIRIIMLDQLDHNLPTNDDGLLIYTCQNDPVYSQEQIDWLCNDALNVTDGTGIIICNHYPFDKTPSNDPSDSLIIDGNYVQSWDMIPKIVNAWQNRTVLNETFNDRLNTQNITVNADFRNIGDRCEFITYLCGHTHYKTHKTIPGFKQIMLLEDSSGSYGTIYSDTVRLAGNPTSNAFSVLSIDRVQKKIYRTSYAAYKSVNENDKKRIEIINYTVE